MKIKSHKNLIIFVVIMIVMATGIMTVRYRQKRKPANQIAGFALNETANKSNKINNLLNAAQLRQKQNDLLKGAGNDHDDPMLLASAGDINSVPAMIAVLKRNPMRPDGIMICTREHCLSALVELTGVNVGKTDEAWEKWWEEYKNKHSTI